MSSHKGGSYGLRAYQPQVGQNGANGKVGTAPNLLDAERQALRESQHMRDLSRAGTRQLFQYLRTLDQSRFELPSASIAQGGRPTRSGKPSGQDTECPITKWGAKVACSHRLEVEELNSWASPNKPTKFTRRLHKARAFSKQQQLSLGEVVDAYCEFEDEDHAAPEYVFLIWKLFTRRNAFIHKRTALKHSLVWNNMERAAVVLQGREVLIEAELFSWLSVPATGKPVRLSDDTEQLSSVESGRNTPYDNGLYHLRELPRVRADTCNEFDQVGCHLRQLVGLLLKRLQERLSRTEQEITDHLMFSGRNCKQGRHEGATLLKLQQQLEDTKHHIMQMPSLLGLLERMHFTCVARSVERCMTSLVQLFARPSCLQILVMGVPRLVPPDVSDPDRCWGAELAASPSHDEVQQDVNSLIQSVVKTAGCCMAICKSVPRMGIDDNTRVAHVDHSATLRSYLRSSQTYLRSIEKLDQYLSHGYRKVDEELRRICDLFGADFAMRVALLSSLYIDRYSLELYRRSQAASSSNDDNAVSREVCSDLEHKGDAMVPELSLGEFVLSWATGPHALEVAGSQRSIIEHLVLSAIAIYDENSPGPKVVCLPRAIALRLAGIELAFGETEAVIASEKVSNASTVADDSLDCVELYHALHAVARGSGSFVDAVVAPLLRLDSASAATRAKHAGLPQDLRASPYLCAWFQVCVNRFVDWQNALASLRPLYPCGCIRLDFEFIMFVAAQIAPAALAVCVYGLNVFAVSNAQDLRTCVRQTLDEVAGMVLNMRELMWESELLGSIYSTVTKYQRMRGALDQLRSSLTSATRMQLVTEIVARLAGNRLHHNESMGSDNEGRGSNAKDLDDGSHPLSESSLVSVTRQIDAMLLKLYTALDEAVKLQDEIMLVAANAQNGRADMTPEVTSSSGVAINQSSLPTTNTAQDVGSLALRASGNIFTGLGQSEQRCHEWEGARGYIDRRA